MIPAELEFELGPPIEIGIHADVGPAIEIVMGPPGAPGVGVTGVRQEGQQLIFSTSAGDLSAVTFPGVTEEQLGVIAEQIMALQEANGNTTEQLAAINAALTPISATQNNHGVRLTGLEGELSSLTITIPGLTNTVKYLQEAVTENRLELTATTQLAQQTASDLTALEAQVGTLGTQAEDHETRLDVAEPQLAQAQAAIGVLQTAVQELEAQPGGVSQTEFDTLSTTVSGHTGQISSLTDVVNGYATQLGQTTQLAQQTASDLGVLTERVDAWGTGGDIQIDGFTVSDADPVGAPERTGILHLNRTTATLWGVIDIDGLIWYQIGQLGFGIADVERTGLGTLDLLTSTGPVTLGTTEVRIGLPETPEPNILYVTPQDLRSYTYGADGLGPTVHALFGAGDAAVTDLSNRVEALEDAAPGYARDTDLQALDGRVVTAEGNILTLQNRKLLQSPGVTLTNPVPGQVLALDGNGNVVNAPAAAGGATMLSQLSDVTVSNPFNKQVLRRTDATTWVNALLNIGDLGDVFTSGAQTGYVLTRRSNGSYGFDALPAGGVSAVYLSTAPGLVGDYVASGTFWNNSNAVFNGFGGQRFRVTETITRVNSFTISVVPATYGGGGVLATLRQISAASNYTVLQTLTSTNSVTDATSGKATFTFADITMTADQFWEFGFIAAGSSHPVQIPFRSNTTSPVTTGKLIVLGRDDRGSVNDELKADLKVNFTNPSAVKNVNGPLDPTDLAGYATATPGQYPTKNGSGTGFTWVTPTTPPLTVTTVSGTVTLVETVRYVRASTINTNYTITLPSTANIIGYTITVKRTDGNGSFNITLAASGQEIDGSATYVLSGSARPSVTLMARSGGWDVI